MMKGVMGQQNSCLTVIVVHSIMYMYMYVYLVHQACSLCMAKNVCTYKNLCMCACTCESDGKGTCTCTCTCRYSIMSYMYMYMLVLDNVN